MPASDQIRLRKRHDRKRKRKYCRGEVSLVEQGTIDYVSTAYIDQEKFKSIYYIKELFSADASIFKKKSNSEPSALQMLALPLNHELFLVLEDQNQTIQT